MSTEKQQLVARTCPLCESTCGLILTIEGDRVLRTAGDEQDVFSRGYMCPKGATLGELHADRDWLRKPVVRDEAGFHEVSWDEAFKRVGELVRPIVETHGAHAMSVYFGNPIGHNLAGLLYPRVFLKALGTPNLYTASTLDQRPKDLSNALLFGDRYTLAVPDLDRTDFLLMLGANPLESNGSLATAPGWPNRLKAIKVRGGTLVVVDPVRTRTAELADHHLRPRVGTDAALLSSIVHVLFDEDLVSLGRLSGFVRGVDQVRTAVADLTPESLSAYTGIPATTVRALARDLAGARSGCVYGRIGTTTTLFGSIASWMVDVLNILTGNLDRPGGAMFPLPASGSANTRRQPRIGPPPRIGRFHTRVRRAPELFGELPTSCLAEEIDTPGEGRYRGLLLISGNPVVSSPNSTRMSAALQSLDALIAVDPYINDTTRHAHVILPPPTPLQRSHYDVHFAMWAVRNVANYSPPVIPLEEGQLQEWEIMCRLAAVFDGSSATAEEVDDRLIESMVQADCVDPNSPIHGVAAEEILRALAPRRGPERILDFLLRVGPYGDGFGFSAGELTLTRVADNPHGIDLGPLQPRLPEVLRTPDGLINVAPDVLVDDLDRLRRAVAEGPADGLVLVGRRHLRSNNSWMHNVPSLMTGRPRWGLQIGHADADARGLESGDHARASTAAGSVDVLVEVSDRLPAGVVSLPHGWLHEAEQVQLRTAQARPGRNSNRLANEYVVDVPSWNAVLSGIPVTVERLVPGG